MICPALRQLCLLLLVYQAVGTFAIKNFTNPYTNNLVYNHSFTPVLPQRKGIHYPCKSDTQCLIDWGIKNTKCERNKEYIHQDYENQICTCDENYVGKYDKNHTLFCFPIRQKLGDRCDIDEQCQYHIKNAVCLKEGKCGCKESTIPDSYSGQCFMKLASWGECDSKSSVRCNITAPGSFCNTTTNLCQCTEGTFFLRSAGICVSSNKALKIGDPCIEMLDRECSLIENSFCQLGLGQCHCMTVSKEAIYYGEETPMKCINEGYNAEGFIRSQLNPTWLLPIRNNVNQGCNESIQCSNLNKGADIQNIAVCKAGRCVLPSERNWTAKIQYKIIFAITSLVLGTLLLLSLGFVLRRKLINRRKSLRGELLKNDALDYANESFDITTEKIVKDNIPLSEIQT